MGGADQEGAKVCPGGGSDPSYTCPAEEGAGWGSDRLDLT